MVTVGKANNPKWKKDMLPEFSDLYNRDLKALFDGGDTGTKHQAHHTEMMGRLDDIEIQQEQANSNIDQLYDNQ